MKVNQGQGGSFGIPPQMQEAAERQRAAADAKLEREEQRKEGLAPDLDAAPLQDEQPKEEEQKPLTAMDLLKSLKVEFTDADLQQLLFRGQIEKEAEVMPQVGTLPGFKATFKTLTCDEYDLVDELLAEDADRVKMTRDGAELRRNMWTLSMGVTKLEGKSLCKPVMDKEIPSEIDLKATAKARRKVLGAMNPGLINIMQQIHGKLTIAFRLMVSDPESLVKNS